MLVNTSTGALLVVNSNNPRTEAVGVLLLFELYVLQDYYK